MNQCQTEAFDYPIQNAMFDFLNGLPTCRSQPYLADEFDFKEDGPQNFLDLFTDMHIYSMGLCIIVCQIPRTWWQTFEFNWKLPPVHV